MDKPTPAEGEIGEKTQGMMSSVLNSLSGMFTTPSEDYDDGEEYNYL